ncbi:hypothetical protein L596_014915 [Steinernema carpocapsae]|uniref:Uncharacterized protein n=1 Tax=Steinernema carpocapsae TaxID=34508 RepID=A0A4U5NDL9_STECR|nr:hypothetical protein L596_014915 [Steinernema carpocapsae]
MHSENSRTGFGENARASVVQVRAARGVFSLVGEQAQAKEPLPHCRPGQDSPPNIDSGNVTACRKSSAGEFPERNWHFRKRNTPQRLRGAERPVRTEIKALLAV